VILIHDVSPVYSDELKEIIDVISAYGLQTSTYLLVIPNHANKHDLREYPEFVDYLHSLEGEGYHIGLHGYNHIGTEFDCNGSVSRRKMENALHIMNSVNLTPEVFLPPEYALSDDAMVTVLRYNLTVITRDSIILPNGTREYIVNREYTWYVSKLELPFKLRDAEKDYLKTRGTFYLSLHPRAINNPAGIEFLREFLQFVKEMDTTGAS
jgi:predicted deacetylase